VNLATVVGRADAPTPPRAPSAPTRGLQFLDVGSGCGVLTACGAWLVGPLGAAVGFDVRREAVSMGRDNVRRLTADSAE
jgi:precorrin-6B methylase 2